MSAPTRGLQAAMRKWPGTGTWRTLPELARQLEHERLGGYRSRERQLADEAARRARGEPVPVPPGYDSIRRSPADQMRQARNAGRRPVRARRSR